MYCNKSYYSFAAGGGLFNTYIMTQVTETPTPENAVWENQKTKLKAKFTHLTDADLNFESGKKDEMLQKVQTKLGKTKDELSSILASL